MNDIGEQRFRYPRRFEYYRLEAFGDDPDGEPYWNSHEAHRRYESGRALFVTPEQEPPQWSIFVSADRYRFALTFYSDRKTPIREVTWEQVDNALFCRRTIDLFYPEGDPGRRLPFTHVIAVTQDISTDGVIDVSLSSPLDEDLVRRVGSAPLDGFRLRVPEFGEWTSLLAASTAPESSRFGIDAIDAAIRFADQCAAAGDPNPSRVGWRIPVGDRDIMKAVDAILDADQTQRSIRILVRGSARILPLSVQAALSSELDPREEQHRMSVLADAVRDACEHREGRAISFDLTQRGVTLAASYAGALRNAGATRADWWAFGRHSVVLVWAGAESEGTLSLAVHVVPVAWVSDRRAKSGVVEADLSWNAADIA